MPHVAPATLRSRRIETLASLAPCHATHQPGLARRQRRVAIAAQLLRIAAPTILLIACPRAPIAWLAAVAIYLGVFTLTHELAHGALGLSRRRTDLALALAGVCMATSGHGLRFMHMRHHASPLGASDLEGRSARMPAWRALLAAPALSIQLVVTALRTATARDRRWQRIEYAALATLASLALITHCAALERYLLVGLAAQLLAPFWAGHLPHRTPAWLLAIARHISRYSMTMRTLVLHDAHHRYPKLPTYALVPLTGATPAAAPRATATLTAA